MQIAVCMLPFASTDDKLVVILIVSIDAAVEADSERSDIVRNGVTIRQARPPIVATASYKLHAY